MSIAEKAAQLRSLVRLISDSAEAVIAEWETEGDTPHDVSLVPRLPSKELFEARRVFIGACGMGMDLVHDPFVRMTEVAASFYNSQALRIAAETRIADALKDANPQKGVSVQEISRQVGIAPEGLSKILRTLSSLHIFAEVEENFYCNTNTSRHLVNNEPLRCWLMVHCMETFTAAGKLPQVLYNTVGKPSTGLRSAFQTAYDYTGSVWEWIEESIVQPDGTVGPRPELDIWLTGMWKFGLEHVQAPAVCLDFPWEAVGSKTVVDVGAGVGGMSFELATRYPKLQFVVQDRPVILEKAKEFWTSSLPDAGVKNRVRFHPQNFFEEQSVKGADIYILRHIMHDWADDECVTILKSLREAMGPESLILVADNVMQTTAGSPHLKPAPAPLPANYGFAHTFANMHDLLMFSMFNGGERTVGGFESLAVRAGLKVTRVWECRGFTSLTEMKRDDHVA
ncbi:hypothetical protein POSPLADRAFT_1031734 [Postia placenta MAD-698-R-SB12]|uniref:O-methyltransferase domain-containing protein n=1 Tax=Postia placenta MAD-698-R-SB12 TaxID=670580 RepID=A0A1X6N7V4_9APHY|nr:hypothetical protein POSPLADRAFT_1031734 [Postia placenta MAD-698-R-SB12]OSX64691.1 hypothetical protein POSPLADRAFT_1031734 [Postia placenta MAD-698-R-SB12]